MEHLSSSAVSVWPGAIPIGWDANQQRNPSTVAATLCQSRIVWQQMFLTRLDSHLFVACVAQ